MTLVRHSKYGFRPLTHSHNPCKSTALRGNMGGEPWIRTDFVTPCQGQCCSGRLRADGFALPINRTHLWITLLGAGRIACYASLIAFMENFWQTCSAQLELELTRAEQSYPQVRSIYRVGKAVGAQAT